jgi:hypothetical protein
LVELKSGFVHNPSGAGMKLALPLTPLVNASHDAGGVRVVMA